MVFQCIENEVPKWLHKDGADQLFAPTVPNLRSWCSFFSVTATKPMQRSVHNSDGGWRHSACQDCSARLALATNGWLRIPNVLHTASFFWSVLMNDEVGVFARSLRSFLGASTGA
jgi:hypothetical protein